MSASARRARHHARALGLLAVLVWMTPATAWAARPLETQDTDVLAPGSVELEVSATYLGDDGARLGAAGAVLNVGVLPRLELYGGTALVVLDPPGERARAGAGDTVVGAKYQLFESAGARPALLGAAELRIPTGDEERGLGARGVDVTALLAIAQTWGPLTLTLNGGFTWVTAMREEDFWIARGSLEYGITRALKVVGEAVSQVRARRAESSVVLRAGLVYRVTDRIDLDAAVAAGLTRESPDVQATLGITIGFGRR